MKLTLVERQEPRLRCVPDLGVAYLLGQCKQNGIDASLIQGSPASLACLLDDSVFGLFCEGYKDIVKQRGEKWFKEFLKFNYNMAVSNEISDKANPEALSDLWELLTYMRDVVWPKWLPDYLFNKISKTKPDAVGFSLWDFYDNPCISEVIASTIKRIRKELIVPVLIGGPGTVTKTSRTDIMSIFRPDLIVHHEGEEALIDAMEMVRTGKKTAKPNISFEGYDGTTKPVENLDALALPDFSQYDLNSFFLPVRVLPMMTSRGCPWAVCAFCNHHATYKGYREYSAERVAETVELYKKRYKTEMIMLHDETFTAERAKSMIMKLPEAYYYSYAYPKGFTKQLLQKMYEKGFRVLVWGVESGCQPVLNRMRKGTKLDEIRRILRDSHSVGITNVAFIMFGFPGETRDQAEETVTFLQRNAQYIERHATTIFRLEENSPVCEQPELWGVKKTSNGYTVDSGMQREDVLNFFSELNKRNIKTAADTKYHMPGDSEFRPYFFMQVVYGEGSGDYPVRTGVLSGNTIWPSLLMKDVSRPKVVLDSRQTTLYSSCDGRHKMDANEFLQYPYIVNYSKPFI